MRKVSLMVVMAVFAALAVATQPAVAKEKKAKMSSSSTKEARWHGTITRSDKDGKTLTVRRRGQQVEKIIHYNDETKWTQGTKSIEMSEVKDGDEVICMGRYDGNDFIATRVDKRPPK